MGQTDGPSECHGECRWDANSSRCAPLGNRRLNVVGVSCNGRSSPGPSPGPGPSPIPNPTPGDDLVSGALTYSVRLVMLLFVVTTGISGWSDVQAFSVRSNRFFG